MRTELPEVTARAACPHDCPDTCGIEVTVRGGKAVSLRGDRDHPFTRGFLCQKVNRYLERVYHPGRLLQPLRRVGPKGAGRFEPMSWDAAVKCIADKFRELVASADGPQSILPYSYCGTMGKLQSESLDRRFFNRLGASRLDRAICSTAGAAGCDITLGTRAVTDPEATTRARVIINWGSNTAATNPHLWSLMLKARAQGATLVAVDPHQSYTASRCDWWLPVRPGTDAALALGVMHVLFRDGLEDRDYLERYCLGADRLRERVLGQYAPAEVSRITGLGVDDIERFARLYGTCQRERGGPALVRLNYGLQRHKGGGMAVRTVACLPAVTGDWRYPGGGALLSTSKLYPFDNAALHRPDLSPPGTRTVNMNRLAEALAGELPGPPVRALFVYSCNPAAVAPDQRRVLQGLRRDDLFTVVHELFHTDTVDYADIVLPSTSQLEHWDLHGSYGHFYTQVNEPCIDAPGEAKPCTEVFRLLARAMNFEPELFEVSDQDLIRQTLRPKGGPNGYPAASAFDGLTLERLQAEGPVRLNVPADYAPFAQGGFGTPSGKCELYSPRLAEMGLDPLPTYTPPADDPLTRPELAARFPLQLITPKAPSFLNSSFVNIDPLRRAAGEPSVELHAADAAARNIADGDAVRVHNDRGEFLARAKVGETVRPGVAVAQAVWWNKHSPGGTTCNSVISTELTDFGGGATFFDALVQVEKAGRSDIA